MEDQSELLSLGTVTTASNESSRKRRKAESNKFKGVVVQPNGHWGAQIYAHDRVWLGTFKSQVEAAMAYDSAAIRLRSGDAHRNFPWTNITMEEPRFQSQFSTDALLGMIKDGSYPTRFSEYLRKQSEFNQVAPSMNRSQTGFVSRKLFQKELTPSDVGKLNRLVIPKKYAMMHFPSISRAILERKGGSGLDDEEMEFVDGSMRTRWKFRYCYWKSSQSFVFTRGWNRFVRENRLKAKDTVVFSLVEFKDASSGEIRSMLMINAGYHVNGFEAKSVSDFVPKSVRDGDLDEGDFEAKCGDFHHGVVEQSKAISKPSLRLFGVEIC